MVGFEWCVVEVLFWFAVHGFAAPFARLTVFKSHHEPFAYLLVPVIVSALCCCLRLVLLVPCACDCFDVCGPFGSAPSQYFVYAGVDDVDLCSGLLVPCEVLAVRFAVHYPHGCACGLQCFGDCCASCGLCHCLHCRCVVVVVCGLAGECVGELIVINGDVAGLAVLPYVGGLPGGGGSGDDVEGDGVCPPLCVLCPGWGVLCVPGA